MSTNGAALANEVNALEQRSNALEKLHQNENIILQQMQTDHDALIAWMANLDQKIDNIQ